MEDNHTCATSLRWPECNGVDDTCPLLPSAVEASEEIV